MRLMQEIVQALGKLLHEGRRGALATVTETGGSAPQKPGSRLLLLPDGERVGTIGGGAVEHHIIDALAKCRDGGEPHTISLNLGKLGMSCGGRMTVFIEPVEAPLPLVVFGAGHIGKAVAMMARAVGFSVTMVDERGELNTEARFPGCRRLVSPLEQALEETAGGHGFSPWFLIMTHDHALDELALEACLRRPHGYIGLIGSQRKVLRILKTIGSKGPLPSLERLFAPVGIDIGAQSPEELAVSIVAEMVALRHGREAAHLRLMGHPLLERVLGGELPVDDAVASLRESAAAGAAERG